MKPGNFNRGRGRGGGGRGGNRQSGGPSPGNKGQRQSQSPGSINKRQSQSPGNKKPFGQIQPFKGIGNPSPNANKSIEKSKPNTPKSANTTPIAKSPGNLGKKSPGKTPIKSPKPVVKTEEDDDDIEDSDEEVEFDSEDDDDDDEELSPEVMQKLKKLQQQQGIKGKNTGEDDEDDDDDDDDDDEEDLDEDEDDDDEEIDMEEIKKLMAQASDDDEDEDDDDDDDDDEEDADDSDADAAVPSAGPIKAGKKRPAELDASPGASLPPAKVSKPGTQSETPARGAKRPAADESPKKQQQQQQPSSNNAKKVKVEGSSTEVSVDKIPVPENVLKEIKQVFSSFGRRSVYIRPIPRNCTAAMLKELSKESINSRIPFDLKKKRNRHYAFLEYKDEQTAAKNAQMLNGKMLDNNPITATLAVKEDVDMSAINPYELFISNLSKKTTQEQVADLFGSAYDVKMPVLKDKSSAGFAFAKFADANEALKAFKASNGVKLNENTIKVVFGKSEELKQQLAEKKKAEFAAWKKSKAEAGGGSESKPNAKAAKAKDTNHKPVNAAPAKTKAANAKEPKKPMAIAAKAGNKQNTNQLNGKAANAKPGKTNAVPQGKKGKKNKKQMNKTAAA